MWFADIETREIRNCGCGSSISIQVRAGDSEKRAKRWLINHFGVDESKWPEGLFRSMVIELEAVRLDERAACELKVSIARLEERTRLIASLMSGS